MRGWGKVGSSALHFPTGFTSRVGAGNEGEVSQSQIVLRYCCSSSRTRRKKAKRRYVTHLLHILQLPSTTHPP